MHKITRKIQLNSEICLIEFEAVDIAASAKPGQFIILRVDEQGERFPLTVYDVDLSKGRVTVVCQAIGVSTKKLCALTENSSIMDAAGPLGHAIDTKNAGKVICIGGGVGTAEAFPIARAYSEAGNDVTVIIGARNKGLVICEKEMRSFCDKVHVTTDDGSYSRKGFVTDVLKELLVKEKYDLVYAIGPVAMMKAVADATRPMAVKTLVSLNSIMIDGTGMCGCCRVRYNDTTKFTCVDGPEFDGHLVDFEDLVRRQSIYKVKENAAMECYDGKCRIGMGKTKDEGRETRDVANTEQK
jgi:NAD(P)H-flavin reductase